MTKNTCDSQSRSLARILYPNCSVIFSNKACTLLLTLPRNKRVIEAEARAEAIRLKAEAQAFAIEAKAKAEAEQMAKKADAWNEYKDAAMVDMILQQLPKVCTCTFWNVVHCPECTLKCKLIGFHYVLLFLEATIM